MEDGCISGSDYCEIDWQQALKWSLCHISKSASVLTPTWKEFSSSAHSFPPAAVGYVPTCHMKYSVISQTQHVKSSCQEEVHFGSCHIWGFLLDCWVGVFFPFPRPPQMMIWIGSGWCNPPNTRKIFFFFKRWGWGKCFCMVLPMDVKG